MAKVHNEAGRAYFGEMWAFSYLPEPERHLGVSPYAISNGVRIMKE